MPLSLADDYGRVTTKEATGHVERGTALLERAMLRESTRDGAVDQESLEKLAEEAIIKPLSKAHLPGLLCDTATVGV